MKKIVPLAILGTAVGAVAYYFNQNNKKHVEKTINALDSISNTAQQTVNDFANEVISVDTPNKPE